VFEPYAQQEVLADQDGRKTIAIVRCPSRRLPAYPCTPNQVMLCKGSRLVREPS
jgi:hypothetical protein